MPLILFAVIHLWGTQQLDVQVIQTLNSRAFTNVRIVVNVICNGALFERYFKSNHLKLRYGTLAKAFQR